MEVTNDLGGANYVLWGGREGYETLLNTNIGQELDQMARFLSMVIDYTHKIGFTGTILIEPKPQEPTKHQYDYDVATVYGFLKKYGLEKDVKVNIEVGHAFLAGHTFEHELALAAAIGILGSVDMPTATTASRAGTPTSSPTTRGRWRWPSTTSSRRAVSARAAPISTPRCAASRSTRSICCTAISVASDVCARGLKAAAAIIEDGTYDKFLEDRYAGWKTPEAQAMLKGERTLDQIAARVEAEDINPQPRSGRQEYLENLINRFV